MKKVFLTVLTLGFLSGIMVSCQSETKKESADSTVVSESEAAAAKTADSLAALPVLVPTKEEIKKAEVKAPDFSNSEVNDGLNEFNSLKKDYANALANKDDEAMKDIITRYNAWVMKTSAYGSKLPADENQKYIEYYEKLAAQWDIIGRQAATKK